MVTWGIMASLTAFVGIPLGISEWCVNAIHATFGKQLGVALDAARVHGTARRASSARASTCSAIRSSLARPSVMSTARAR